MPRCGNGLHNSTNFKYLIINHDNVCKYLVNLCENCWRKGGKRDMKSKDVGYAVISAIIAIAGFYLVFSYAEQMESITAPKGVITGIVGIIIMAIMAFAYGNAVGRILKLFGIEFEEEVEH
jgi:hypothetical protein